MMLPKDLLNDLEKGNRTMEVLEISSSFDDYGSFVIAPQSNLVINSAGLNQSFNQLAQLAGGGFAQQGFQQQKFATTANIQGGFFR